MSGNYNSQAENNINVPMAMQHVRDAVAATAAANEQSQAEARAFIVENGAQVLGGHSPVNPADTAFMNPPMTVPAPTHPLGYDTFAEQAALVGPPSADNMGLLHPSSAMAPNVIDAGED